MPEDSVKQSEMPEAIGSASYSLISPNGFPMIFTIRQPDMDKLIGQMQTAEMIFIRDEYKPDIKRFGKPKRELDVVPDRKCPQCGNDLVYFEAKGLKHIKCSTQKYDFTTKQRTGCAFVEWADNPLPAVNPTPTAPPAVPPLPVTQVQPTQALFEPATQSQITLIKNKLPDMYHEGISKTEAHTIINNYLAKT